MKTFYKVLVVIAMIISVLMILLALVGMGGSWWLNERLTNTLVNVVQSAGVLVNGINTGLERANEVVGSGREIITEINGYLEDTGELIQGGEPLLNLVDRLLGEELGQKINTALNTIRTILDSVASLNQFLESLNEIPFVEVPTLTDQLKVVEDKVNEVIATIQEIRLRFQEFRTSLVETMVTPIIERTTRVDNDLAFIEEQITGYISLASTIQVALGELEAKLPLWLDILTIIISLVLVWGVVAQLAVLLAGYNYLKFGVFVLRRQPVAATEMAGMEGDAALPVEEPKELDMGEETPGEGGSEAASGSGEEGDSENS